MNRFCLAFTFFFALTFIDVYAHTLWIETSPIGKKGQKQSIKISYAEPGETTEKVADWYSAASLNFG